MDGLAILLECLAGMLKQVLAILGGGKAFLPDFPLLVKCVSRSKSSFSTTLRVNLAEGNCCSDFSPESISEESVSNQRRGEAMCFHVFYFNSLESQSSINAVAAHFVHKHTMFTNSLGLCVEHGSEARWGRPQHSRVVRQHRRGATVSERLLL